MRRNLRSSNDLRRASVAPFLLFVMSALLACFAFAVNKSWLWSVREDIKLATDAAALAAAGALANDDLIRNDVSLYPDLLSRSSAAAVAFAAANPVRTHPLVLLDNQDNLSGGDIVFGVLSTPRSGDFLAVPSRATPDADQARTNTVFVKGSQTKARGTAPGMIFGVFAGHGFADVVASSAVTLDRGFRGLRPGARPTPLAPFALLSDPSLTNPLAFETAVEGGIGPDMVRYDADSKTFVADPAGDGIREFTVSFATDPMQLATSNAALIHLGTTNLTQLAELLINGVTGDDLIASGRQFVLPETMSQGFAGQDTAPPGDSPETLALYGALLALQQSAEVRIWPLYSVATPTDVTVTGFVAARVVSVIPPTANSPLLFTLQATVTARPDAVTDTDLRGAAATLNNNRYVIKIRRVE